MNDLGLMKSPVFVKSVIRSALLISTGILSCITMSVFLLAAQTTIGHVLDIKGDWYLYPEGAESLQKQRLIKWQDVPAGGVIRITAPSKDDFIIIADIHLNILAQKKCAGPDTCYQPIFLPNGIKEKNELSDALDSLLPKVWALLWGEPYERSLHRTRGASPLLGEEIAPLMKGELNLSELMHAMPKGRYSVVPYDLESGNERGETTSFSWEPIGNGVPSLMLTPGLYEISRSPTTEGEKPLQDVSIRLLAVQLEDYPREVTAFEKVRASTEKWATAADEETVHAFLRAYLSELSTANSTKKP